MEGGLSASDALSDFDGCDAPDGGVGGGGASLQYAVGREPAANLPEPSWRNFVRALC